MSGGKFIALVQKYEMALRTAKDEVFRLQQEEHEKAKDVDTMVADLKLVKLALEGKVAALNKEIVKTIGLQDKADRLRAQMGDLEEKARRDAEASAAEMKRLRRSRRKWRLSGFDAQRDVVEVDVGRRQVDEALLDFVKKIRGVDLNFDAMEGKLAAKLAKSIADGDAIDEVVIDDDDFVKPNREGFCFFFCYVMLGDALRLLMCAFSFVA
ncbi:unnamed protein product [Microthlaspi erraticum]|uniref:Uncharacterized protein n=1 Tax=Microthlaspi erraticum TaxID=1685480 RepID=A0A6D2I4B5_9BRAS|nr:unnamed protein product [Microthlaspi erraticum]